VPALAASVKLRQSSCVSQAASVKLRQWRDLNDRRIKNGITMMDNLHSKVLGRRLMFFIKDHNWLPYYLGTSHTASTITQNVWIRRTTKHRTWVGGSLWICW